MVHGLKLNTPFNSLHTKGVLQMCCQEVKMISIACYKIPSALNLNQRLLRGSVGLDWEPVSISTFLSPQVCLTIVYWWVELKH